VIKCRPVLTHVRVSTWVRSTVLSHFRKTAHTNRPSSTSWRLLRDTSRKRPVSICSSLTGIPPLLRTYRSCRVSGLNGKRGRAMDLSDRGPRTRFNRPKLHEWPNQFARKSLSSVQNVSRCGVQCRQLSPDQIMAGNQGTECRRHGAKKLARPQHEV
jgi:hypothetical protein